MEISNFIDSVASGNAVEAKDVLNDLLAARAFEALDVRKQEIAHNLFADAKEPEVQDTEETETE